MIFTVLEQNNCSKTAEGRGQTGVQIELPGRDGVWVTITAIPIFAFLSVDNKEAKALTHVKDAYRAMPAFCVQCTLANQRNHCRTEYPFLCVDFQTVVPFKNKKLA